MNQIEQQQEVIGRLERDLESAIARGDTRREFFVRKSLAKKRTLVARLSS